jgi:hypothetical protein
MRVANKNDMAMVTTEALAVYSLHHGIKFDHCLVAVSMVAPGTWTLTLKDTELATCLTSLYKVILFGKELSICLWKDSLRQSKHQAYVSGITETTSRQGVVKFFRHKCSDMIDHHFSKLADSRPAPWITIQFKRASNLSKALKFNSKPPLPPLPWPPHSLCYPSPLIQTTSISTASASPSLRPNQSVKLPSSAWQDQRLGWQLELLPNRPACSAKLTRGQSMPLPWLSMKGTLLLAQNFPKRP